MQFIPSTWAAYGTDATGDGVTDVFNINDAALAAARYLCAAGGNLRTHAGQVAAVLAYNHSDQYLAQVLALADAYRTGLPAHGIPVGNITGGLPPVSNTSAVPPVNPGPPTANSPTTTKKAAAGKPAATTTPSPAPAKSTSPTSASASPAPGATSGATSSGSVTSSTTPRVAAPTSSASPTPTPTKTCIVWDIIDPTKCDLYA